MTNIFSKNDLEILIATKNRDNLDFLALMFPFASFSNFNILIINQSKDTILSSEFETVRVINVDEKGLHHNLKIFQFGDLKIKKPSKTKALQW